MVYITFTNPRSFPRRPALFCDPRMETSLSPNVLTLIAHDDAGIPGPERSVSKKRRSAKETEDAGDCGGKRGGNPGM